MKKFLRRYGKLTMIKEVLEVIDRKNLLINSVKKGFVNKEKERKDE
jgi:hypothetical protein